ncbi:MAG TPA: hypothetical protein VIW68_10105, partial [Candidatus Sulfotelmatobacter sp.]
SGSLATVPLDEWNLLLSVNLTGYLLCAQYFGKAMSGFQRFSQDPFRGAAGERHARIVECAHGQICHRRTHPRRNLTYALR